MFDELSNITNPMESSSSDLVDVSKLLFDDLKKQMELFNITAEDMTELMVKTEVKPPKDDKYEEEFVQFENEAIFQIPKFAAHEELLLKVDGLARELLGRMLNSISVNNKINVDTVQETFSYLSLLELCQIAECDGFLKELVGNYVRRAYPKLQIDSDSPFIYRRKVSQVLCGYAKHVYDFELNDLKSFSTSFPNDINSIRFGWIPDGEKIDFAVIKDKLENIEEINIREGCHEDGHYGSLLKYCKNLKSLTIGCHEFDESYDYLKHKFAKLEHFYLGRTDTCRHVQIRHFIQKHKNLKSLTLGQRFFSYRTARRFLVTVNRITYTRTTYNFIKFLNGPDGKGIIDSLFVKVDYSRLMSHPQYLLLLKNIKSIDINNYSRRIRIQGKPTILSQLPDLKQFKINKLRSSYYDHLLKGLEDKLEIIDIETVYDRDVVLRIIKSFKQLKKLCLRRQHNWSLLKDYNVKQLNIERDSIPGASKLIIYVNEMKFLEYKWRGEDINSELIELKPFYRQHDDPIHFDYYY